MFRPPRRAARALGALALHLALATVLLSLLLHGIDGPLPADNPRMQLVLGVGSLAWLIACALGARGFGSGRLVVAGAISLQLLALVGEPSLSDDVYRYVWEGELVAQGVSPYAHAPDSAALAAQRAALAEVFARVNHPDVSAAYPPVAQYVFAALALATRWLGGTPEGLGVLAMRLVFALCAVLALIPIFALLDRFGRPRSAAVAWGWSPLVALEFAGSGHFDSLGILLLLAGLALWSRPQHKRSAVDEGGAVFALSLATLVKFLPGLALLFALRERPKKRLFAWTMFVIGVGILPVFMFPERASGLFRGLSTYGRTWEGGSLVHRWLDAGLRTVELPWDLDPQPVGRLVLAGMWLVCFALAWQRRWGALRASGFLIAALLVLSPTVHPWYLTWVVPFLALRPSPALFVWVAAAPVLYWPLAGWLAEGVWVEPTWLAPTFSITIGVLLSLELAWHGLRGAAKARASSEPVAPTSPEARASA